MRLFINVISLLLGLSLGLISLYNKKIQNIIAYNQTQLMINKNIIHANEVNNKELKEYIKKITENMSLNYRKFIQDYKRQQEEKQKQQRILLENMCKNMFKDYMNSIIIYPNENYIKYVFYKELYNNLKLFSWYTRLKIKRILGSFGYETYYHVKKYDRDNFINSLIYIKTPSKYNIFSLDKGLPNIYFQNKDIALGYYTNMANKYSIDKINLTNNNNFVYVDTILYFYFSGVDQGVKGLISTYYKLYKNCKETITGDNLILLGKKCGYLTNKDLDKLYDAFKKKIKYSFSFQIIDPKFKEQYNKCIKSGFTYVNTNIANNLHIVIDKLAKYSSYFNSNSLFK